MNDYKRIEKAIIFIEGHFTEQPSLQEIADHVGVSLYHFQRIFKQWAGITPKRFIQHLTAQYGGSELRKSKSVLEASLDCGLSSTSRLHELIVNVYAMTPDEYRRHGATLEIEYGWHSTPFGECLLAKTHKGVCWISFHDSNEHLDELKREWRAARFVEKPTATEKIVNFIFDSSKRENKTLQVHVKGTNLQIKVWEALLKIPPARLVSYSQLAHDVNRPKAVRAVASAVGRNEISFVIPCHRVIRQTGAIGGYRWGIERKKVMQAWESAQLADY